LLSRLYREFFKALSNETRFAIVHLLRSGPHHVSEIVDKLGVEQSRVSHNLACLLNCGFVLWEWQGKNKVYRLNQDLLPVLAGIEKHLARYAPALESCGVLEAESKPVVIISKATQRSSRSQRRFRSVKK
jgi:ArsR family transcriptional regulator, cadmium/lead-responsive transcriptional repressor